MIDRIINFIRKPETNLKKPKEFNPLDETALATFIGTGIEGDPYIPLNAIGEQIKPNPDKLFSKLKKSIYKEIFVSIQGNTYKIDFSKGAVELFEYKKPNVTDQSVTLQAALQRSLKAKH